MFGACLCLWLCVCVSDRREKERKKEMDAFCVCVCVVQEDLTELVRPFGKVAKLVMLRAKNQVEERKRRKTKTCF